MSKQTKKTSKAWNKQALVSFITWLSDLDNRQRWSSISLSADKATCLETVCSSIRDTTRPHLLPFTNKDIEHKAKKLKKLYKQAIYTPPSGGFVRFENKIIDYNLLLAAFAPICDDSSTVISSQLENSTSSANTACDSTDIVSHSDAYSLPSSPLGYYYQQKISTACTHPSPDLKHVAPNTQTPLNKPGSALLFTDIEQAQGSLVSAILDLTQCVKAAIERLDTLCDHIGHKVDTTKNSVEEKTTVVPSERQRKRQKVNGQRQRAHPYQS